MGSNIYRMSGRQFGPIVKWYYGSMAWIKAGFDSPWVHRGGVAEWFKATLLKSVIRGTVS